MIKTAAFAVKGAADSAPNTTKTAVGNIQTQAGMLNKTTNSPPNSLADLGNSTVTSSGGDDQTYPGLEKPHVSQQELK